MNHGRDFMRDRALEWLLPQLLALKGRDYQKGPLAQRVTLLTNWLWMDERFDTNIEHLHCLGDSSGWTRGLMMSSVMGLLMGEELAGRA